MDARDKREELTNKVKLTFNDAVKGLKIFALNPVGGLPDFFKGLGQERALGVGIAFGLFYIFCFVFSIGSLTEKSTDLLDIFDVEVSSTHLILLSVANFLSIVGASFITRKLFRGYGQIQGDVFIAGVALAPISFLILLTKLLGIGNVEIITIVAIIAITYTILMLYTGCNQISGIAETASALSVSAMIILSVWLYKIMISMAFT
jgi:hypothetical protein